MRDPYGVLGVSKGADAKDVKAAYRKLARELHPDLHPGDAGAEERFKEVAAAYDFLRDADRKARYDRGEIDATGAPTAQRTFYRTYADSGGGERYADPRAAFGDFEAFDMFADLFGGRRAGRTTRSRGADIRYTLDVEFVDAIKGTTRALEMPGGPHLPVTIPPGSADGHVLRLRRQGRPGVGGGDPGDALIELHVRPHSAFTRNGADIRSEVAVSLPEAVLGARIQVPTVDGPVTLTVPKGSNTGSRLRLKGKGVPTAGGPRGDHYVTLKVMLPDRPDPALAEFVAEWAKTHPYPVRDERGGTE